MRRERLARFRFRFADEPAGPPDQLAVGVDLALAPEVADQVEVERGAILPAELREPHPERDVHRAADLLVEEDVARESVDLVVEAECDLADPASAAVHRQERLEIAEAPCRLRAHDAAVLEAKAQIVDLASFENGREAEPDRP